MKDGGIGLDRWFRKLVEQVTLSRSETSLTEALNTLTAEAGFRYFAYLNIQNARQTAISNYSEEWQGRYFGKGYASIDPVVLKAKARPDAFAWSNRETPGLSRKRRTFYGEAAEFGIRSGISVPIDTGFGCMAMLTLASNEPDFAEGLELHPVKAAASFGQVHARIESMWSRPRPGTRFNLTAEELTCLRWASEGKRMLDIAAIENEKYSNVAFHIDRAKKALGVSTLPHATALAKELGLI